MRKSDNKREVCTHTISGHKTGQQPCWLQPLGDETGWSATAICYTGSTSWPDRKILMSQVTHVTLAQEKGPKVGAWNWKWVITTSESRSVAVSFYIKEESFHLSSQQVADEWVQLKIVFEYFSFKSLKIRTTCWSTSLWLSSTFLS